MATRSPWYVLTTCLCSSSDVCSLRKLGYGTGTAWYKTGDESQIDQACIDSIKTAIGLGYYHLDGAEVYKTEPELGIAIK